MMIPLNTCLVPMHPVQAYEMWPDKDLWVMRAKDRDEKMSRTPMFVSFECTSIAN